MVPIGRFFKDFISWSLTLLVIVLLSSAIWIGLPWLTNWVFGISDSWWWIFHFAFQTIVGGTIVGAFIFLCNISLALASIVLRQKKAFAVILGLALLLVVGHLLYITWSSSIQFDWEFYNHPFTNRLLFSVLCLFLLSIPVSIYKSDDV